MDMSYESICLPLRTMYSLANSVRSNTDNEPWLSLYTLTSSLAPFLDRGNPEHESLAGRPTGLGDGHHGRAVRSRRAI
jgi:hypothetical protein